MNPADFLVALGRSSLAAGVLVLVVLMTQRLFRRQLSPQWQAALWLVVAVRVLPFSFTSDVSVFNLLPRSVVESAGRMSPHNLASLLGTASSPLPATTPSAGGEVQ